jgi:putative membrane protein
MKPEWWTPWHDQYWPWHVAGHLAWYAFLIIAVVLIASIAMRWLKQQPGSTASALDTLKERYARGEIGKDDFDRIKKDLTA